MPMPSDAFIRYLARTRSIAAIFIRLLWGEEEALAGEGESAQFRKWNDLAILRTDGRPLLPDGAHATATAAASNHSFVANESKSR